MLDFWLRYSRASTWAAFLFQKLNNKVIKAYFSSITRNEGLKAFDLWKFCLLECVDVGGNYFEHS